MAESAARREVLAAIEAGRAALEALEEASEALESAKRWGVWDIVGGGFFSSMVKHARIDEARDALARARQALAYFSHKASDVGGIGYLDVGVSNVEAFFDIAFDNAVTDIFVQRKIDDAADRAEDAARQVQAAINRLYGLL